MYRRVLGFLVVLALSGASAEAQTITGRIEPVWDPDLELYTYGYDNSLYWRLQVAPSSARSDELSVNLYYNKRAAAMAMTVFCREDALAKLETHALSFSAEHFLSLTTGLITGEDCYLLLRGASDRDEVLSYRMAVSERVARSNSLVESSNSATGSGLNGGMTSVAQTVSRNLRRMVRARANGGRD
ncbi:MAG: hypothetical protein OXE40_09090 [Gammaproteobacteria bacterium]|nr:hypothetical protein [Gammaproteobacteria bacterium]